MTELVPRFLQSCIARGISPKTIRANSYELNWLLALNPFSAVDALDVGRIVDAANAKGWSNSHKANVLTTIQRFVRWAGRKDFTIRAPTKDSRGAESVISPETWELVLRETTGDFHQLLRVLWHSGARPGEISGLTVEAMDWPTGTAKLKNHKTRHRGKQRILYFGPEALTILRKQAERHKTGPLFRGQRGQHFTPHAIAVRFIRLCERHGVKVTSYCFRHTWATRALSAGVPDTHVAALLGHSSTRMIHANYSHVNQNAALLKEVAARVE